MWHRARTPDDVDVTYGLQSGLAHCIFLACRLRKIITAARPFLLNISFPVCLLCFKSELFFSCVSIAIESLDFKHRLAQRIVASARSSKRFLYSFSNDMPPVTREAIVLGRTGFALQRCRAVGIDPQHRL